MVSLRCSINKLFVEFHHCAVRSYSSKFFSTCKMTTKSALVLLAEEAEEMELVISVDILRRAGVWINFMLITFIQIWIWNFTFVVLELRCLFHTVCSGFSIMSIYRIILFIFICQQ